MKHEAYAVPFPVVSGVAGTVDGWEAVFQVAVVGYAVVATVGDVVPYGVGPGMV